MYSYFKFHIVLCFRIKYLYTLLEKKKFVCINLASMLKKKIDDFMQPAPVFFFFSSESTSSHFSLFAYTLRKMCS